MIDRIAPTRRPAGKVAGFQRWRSLLFLHWPAPVEVLRSLVPADLSLDLHDGVAYVGVVPFAMQGVRPWWWPKAFAFNFLETNVRTYVLHGNKPGVYFFSLDANSRAAVFAARTGWGLPYYYARMEMSRSGDEIGYHTRRASTGAALEVRYQLGESLGASQPATLEHFLLERYLLFVKHRGQLLAGQVHHTPYPVQKVHLLEVHDELMAAAGFPLASKIPALAHYSPGVDVEIFRCCPHNSDLKKGNEAEMGRPCKSAMALHRLPHRGSHLMKGTNVIAWLPIAILPAAVIAFTPGDWPRWVFMWLLGWTIFAGCKWLTWWTALPSTASWPRQLGYLLAWPGLDAPAFLNTPSSRRPALGDWLFALGKVGFGAALLWICVPRLPAENELLRGWVGIVGVGFVLHFGVFHLLSLFWQTLDVNAKPLMNWPILASSVSDFWGQRWNTAFRDLTHRFLFRPLTARFGAKPALLIGFVFSGIVHELVISLPASGGYGGPTLFFLLQAAAIFLERSTLGRRLGLGHGVRGWAFALLVLAGPAFLLFHPPFVRECVVPFVDWIARI